MKAIDLPQAIALYMAAVLGSGILFLTGSTAAVAGPASLVSWMIIIGASLPIAYTFAMLAKWYPDAGGVSTFVKKAFHRELGGMVGWMYFFCATSGQMIVSLTGAYYLASAFHLSSFYVVLFAILILVMAGTANIFGLRVSGKLAIVISSMLVMLLLSTIVIAVPHMQWHHFRPFAPSGWNEIGTALMMMFWLFFGWEAICHLAPRFARPRRDIGLSTMISLGIVSVLALSLSFVTIGTKTYGEEGQNLSPIGTIMSDYIGLNAGIVTGIIAFIICLGTVNAFIASLAHLGYALSREKKFPKYFFHKHPSTDQPVRVIVLVVVLAILGVCLCGIYHISYDALLFIPNSLGLTVYVLLMGAGMKLLPSNTLPWWTASLAFTLCIAYLPFFGQYMVVPLLVALAYACYQLKPGGKKHENIDST